MDGQGSRPDGSGRELYGRLLAGGVDVRVVRATWLRGRVAAGGRGGPRRWGVSQLGHIDHRKFVVVDGRVGWVGGAGIEDHFDDGRFHDLFLQVDRPGGLAAAARLPRDLPLARGSDRRRTQLDALLPAPEDATGSVPATVLHNAPGRYRPITTAIAEALDGARETLDVVNPYVTDRRMIGRIEGAARRGVEVRLFVPAKANNWPCAAAQRFHHEALLDAGVRILGHPAMLHAKALVRDREDVLVGTCNLDAWSLKRFFEIDVLVRSRALAAQLDERFLAPAEAASTPGPGGDRGAGAARVGGVRSDLAAALTARADGVAHGARRSRPGACRPRCLGARTPGGGRSARLFPARARDDPALMDQTEGSTAVVDEQSCHGRD